MKMEEKVYWEDLMENLAKEFGITVVVRTSEGIDIYKPGGDE